MCAGCRRMADGEYGSAPVTAVCGREAGDLRRSGLGTLYSASQSPRSSSLLISPSCYRGYGKVLLRKVRTANATSNQSPREPAVSSELRTIEALLPGLSPGDKARLLQWLAQDLGGATPGIEKTTGVCGGATRIVRTSIPVRVLEQARRLGSSEVDILRCYPTLRAEDLAKAWSYVRRRRTEIERDIAEKEA